MLCFTVVTVLYSGSGGATDCSVRATLEGTLKGSLAAAFRALHLPLTCFMYVEEVKRYIRWVQIVCSGGRV